MRRFIGLQFTYERLHQIKAFGEIMSTRLLNEDQGVKNKTK